LAALGVETTTGWLSSAPDADMLMHEHILAGYIGSEWDPAVQPDLDAELARLTKHLVEEREKHGLGLIVDAGPASIGRDVTFLARLEAASSVHVVACSGFYVSNRGGFPFHFQKMSDDELDAFVIAELTEGVVGSGGVKCGAIKLGSAADEIDRDERRAFGCGARVSKRLGTAILTHTDLDGWRAGNVGLHQLEALVEAGADPERVAIGHCYLPVERLDELIAICREGAFVAFDHMGWHNEAEQDGLRIELVLALARAGFTEQILLSHDWPAVWRGPVLPMFASGPGDPFADGLGLIREKVWPALRASGLTEREFKTIMRRNPWRFLAH
jgi:predicted metal-dependent phosphotriesterase family hydrolase